MGDDVVITITGDSAQAIAAIQQTQNAIQHLAVVTKSGVFDKPIMPIPANAPEQFAQLGNAAKKVGADAGEAAGMSRREWMRTGSEIAFYFQQAAGKSGELNKSVVDGIGLGRQLGESFMYGGGIGIAVALISTSVGALIAEFNKAGAAAKAAADEIKASFTDAKKQLDATLKLDQFDAMARVTGVGKQALDEYAKSSAYATTQVYALNESMRGAGERQALLADLQAKYNQALLDFNAGTTVAADGTKTFSDDAIRASDAMQIFASQIDAATIGLNYYTDQQNLAAAAIRQAGLDAADTTWRLGEMARMNQKASALDDYATRQVKAKADANKFFDAQMIADDAKAASAAEKYATDYTNALQKVKDAQDNLLKDMVGKSLTPTSVTSEDMQAAKLGTYANKWDEFRRRIEAVVKGADPSQFGADFANALAKLNMPLDAAAEKFKNFSLFADPKNLKLVDWNAVTTDIGDQLLQLVGKANVMKEGMAKAWAGLSASQKKSLRELGIESAGDAKKVLTGTAENLLTPFVDPAQVKNQKAAGAALVQSVQSGMLDPKTLKTWTSTVDTLVQNAVNQFTIADNVKKLLDSGTAMVQSLADGIGQSNAITDALNQLVNQAIADALATIQNALSGGVPTLTPAIAVPESPALPGFASGGMGVFARGGLVKVDDGEGYHFTGRNGGLPQTSGNGIVLNLTYAPTVSLASRAEAVGVLAPVIRQALREIQQRKT